MHTCLSESQVKKATMWHESRSEEKKMAGLMADRFSDRRVNRGNMAPQRCLLADKFNSLMIDNENLMMVDRQKTADG